MKTLTAEAFDQYVAESTVHGRDAHGPKVIQLPNGDFIKVFRLKRALSSARFLPYARRFEIAADELRTRHIPTVDVKEVWHIRGPKKDAVLYSPLPGETLRDALAQSPTPAPLVEQLASFLAELHAKGVYFRAIHLANVVVTPEGNMGLIDISEVHTRRRGLGLRLRARNFKPLVRYPVDREALDHYGMDDFIRLYTEHAGLTGRNIRQIRALLAQTHSAFRDASHDDTEKGLPDGPCTLQ